jgi:dihydroorotase
VVDEPELVLAGRAWVRGRLDNVEIAIDSEGQIQRIAKDLRGGERHDVGQAIILPSATDLHVHFREPSPSSTTENFRTGTLQAALGGVGLVGEMPNTQPPVIRPEDVLEKASRASGNLAVDLFLYAALTPSSSVPAVAREAAGFKLYLSPTSGFPSPMSPAELQGKFREVAASGLPLSVHAENPLRFRENLTPLDTVGWNEVRPPEAETSAVDELFPTPDGLRLHVAHVTLAASAEHVRMEGHSFEATPHHLLLSARPGQEGRFKVNPPLRSEPDRLALWSLFQSGTVPCLASDHAPHDSTLKDSAFVAAPSGVPGVETMLPLFLAKVRSADLSLPVLIMAAVERPARLLGVPHGRISPGHRANLIVVDFKAVTEISARRLHAPCGWTPFEGWPAVFPTEHYRNGRRIVEDAEFVGDWQGQVVRPEYAPS